MSARTSIDARGKPYAIFVTPVLPEPVGSGRVLRAWDWLGTLSETHEVIVLVVSEVEIEPIPASYPARVWRVASSAPNARGARALGQLLPFLVVYSRRFGTGWVSGDPNQIDEFVVDLAGAKIDRIVVFRLFLHDVGQALSKALPTATLEMDCDDLESSTRRSVALCTWRLGRYREAMRGLATAAQFGFFQRLARGNYATIYLASPLDVRRLRTRLGREVSVRPNRVVIPTLQHTEAPSEAAFRILFVGTLDYPPNEEAARLLAGKILPALARRARRDWRVRIVGRNASLALSRYLASFEGVEFVSDAQEVTEHYAAAAAAVVPLRAGGGTKFKTLEAFAHRRPVVSTAEGVSGLPVVAGKHYIRAETITEFADAIFQLVSDRRLSQGLVDTALSLCRDKYQVN